jgi:beta-phosphoglucomutase
MKIKACLFDLDGVIVDTAKYHYIAWKELANGLGFDFTEKDNERLKGVSRMASLEILLEIGGISLPDDQKQALATKKNDRYVEYITQMKPDEVLPGAKEFLIELRQMGIKTALGSASKNAMTILDRLDLAPLFDAIVDGNIATKAKPHPQVFLMGAQAVGCTPNQCVVFEDAEAGVEAAIAAGMKCVGIGSPINLGKANLVIDGLHHMTIEKLKTL